MCGLSSLEGACHVPLLQQDPTGIDGPLDDPMVPGLDSNGCQVAIGNHSEKMSTISWPLASF